LMRSAVATDEPPYFCTTRATAADSNRTNGQSRKD
jgi:hypothetical protein